MRLLNGADVASYIVERQAKQVRALRQAHHIIPRLAIILNNDDLASEKYVNLKKHYGEDVLIEVIIEKVATVDEVLTVIDRHNADPLTHGIIVQVPIADEGRTDEVLQRVAPEKDVDGLGSHEFFDPATPTAILWLLASYNVEPRGKKVVVIGGTGRLVGAPLVRMLQSTGVKAVVAGRDSALGEVCADADIIITAAGVPGLLTSEFIPQKAVVVDAGTTSEGGVLKGDVADEVYQTRDDLSITPKRGGVGPLTVVALFDAVIQAARRVASQQKDAA